MIRRLFFSLIALTSACTLFTDLDGFTSTTTDGGDANVSTPIEAGVEASACKPGQDFPTDPKNCGVCGRDCRGGACLASSCQPVMLASDIKTDHIRLDATHAYFADQKNSSISRAPKNGSGPVETLATGIQGLYEFTLSDDHVYFMTSTGISRVKKTGGMPEAVANTGLIGYIEVHDGFLFHASGADDGSSQIVKANLDGTNATPIVKNRFGIETFAFDGDELFYAENGQGGSASIRVLHQSTAVDDMLSGEKCRRLVIDKANIYYLDYFTPSVWSLPRTGGKATPIANSVGITYDGDMAIDDTTVYWAVKNDPGGVYSVAKTGGPITTISTLPKVSGLALDGDAVFWSLQEAFQIYFRVVR